MSMCKVNTLNVVKFENISDEEFKEIADYLKGENKEGTIDFNRVRAMPKELEETEHCQVEESFQMYSDYMLMITKFPGLVSEAELKAYLYDKYDLDEDYWELGKASYKCNKKYGFISAYEWRESKWGCEFNPWWGKRDDAEHQISFVTESDVADMIMRISALYPEVHITAICAEREVDGYISTFKFLDGEVLSSRSLHREDPECYELLTKTWKKYLFDKEGK